MSSAQREAPPPFAKPGPAWIRIAAVGLVRDGRVGEPADADAVDVALLLGVDAGVHPRAPADLVVDDVVADADLGERRLAGEDWPGVRRRLVERLGSAADHGLEVVPRLRGGVGIGVGLEGRQPLVEGLGADAVADGDGAWSALPGGDGLLTVLGYDGEVAKDGEDAGAAVVRGEERLDDEAGDEVVAVDDGAVVGLRPGAASQDVTAADPDGALVEGGDHALGRRVEHDGRAARGRDRVDGGLGREVVPVAGLALGGSEPPRVDLARAGEPGEEDARAAPVVDVLRQEQRRRRGVDRGPVLVGPGGEGDRGRAAAGDGEDATGGDGVGGAGAPRVVAELELGAAQAPAVRDRDAERVHSEGGAPCHRRDRVAARARVRQHDLVVVVHDAVEDLLRRVCDHPTADRDRRARHHQHRPLVEVDLHVRGDRQRARDDVPLLQIREALDSAARPSHGPSTQA